MPAGAKPTTGAQSAIYSCTFLLLEPVYLRLTLDRSPEAVLLYLPLNTIVIPELSSHRHRKHQATVAPVITSLPFATIYRRQDRGSSMLPPSGIAEP